MATELQRQGDTGVTTQEPDEFAALLKQSFRPRNERAASEVESAVATLVSTALADTTLLKDDVLDTLEAMIAAIDKQVSDQVNEIIHAPEFQQIESAWRGLNYLVMNSETDANLKISVMNVGKRELLNNLRLYPGARWDQSPLFKQVYEQEFGTLGGQPIGAMVCDYEFTHEPTDVQLMRALSKIAASAHMPLFAAAGPTLMGMDSWTELMNPRDLSKLFDTPDYAAWKSLRDAEDSRYVGLCMPRVLSRLPYGAKSDPVEEFAFEEATDGHAGTNYAWMNAAYAMATNINRAFKEYGWCTRIRGVESGGEVINLPTHTFATDDGGVDLKCPTEIAITDRREAELAKSGLIPLVHRKNTDKAAFIGAQSLYRPKKMSTDEATASENLSVAVTLYVRCVALRALFEVHGSRQGRIDQGTGGAPGLASDLDHPLYRWRSEGLVRAHQGREAIGRRPGRGDRERGKSGLLFGPFLPSAALSIGRHGYRDESRFASARKGFVSFSSRPLHKYWRARSAR